MKRSRRGTEAIKGRQKKKKKQTSFLIFFEKVNIIEKNNLWEIGNEYLIHLIVWFEKIQQRNELRNFRKSDFHEKNGPLKFIDVCSKLPQNFTNKEVNQKNKKERRNKKEQRN